MNHRKQLFRLFSMMLGLLSLYTSGCGHSTAEEPSGPPDTENPDPGQPQHPFEPVGTSLFLQVVDEGGGPVSGAAVSALDAVFPVDSSGHLLLENLSPGSFLARVDALGFTSATAVVELQAGAHLGTQVKLLRRPPPIPFQVEQGGVIQTEQVRVVIPPDAVVDALGQPVSGTVNVTINPIDPTVQLSSMPGPLEGTAASDSARVSLESFFMAEVSLWSHDSPVQLAPGKTADLEFVLPESLASQFQVGDSVPAWWFDLDAGLWREEGTGTVQLSQTQPGKRVWSVQVNHFTWWNCDAPWTDKSCVNVFVVDKMGRPLSGAAVTAQGVSYAGASRTSYTGANGRTCIEIKRGATANVYAGLVSQSPNAVEKVIGTQAAALCGSNACTEVALTMAEIICQPGAYASCPYSGPAEAEGKGVCRAGRQQCNILGTAWSVCQGEVLPAAESCRSPFDEDCDGELNEGCNCSDLQGLPCYGGPSETKDVGICHGGTLACDLFGNTVCQEQQLPRQEVCSTIEDEDCNGTSESCGPSSWGWLATGPMADEERLWHTATLLHNGKVLVAGGIFTTSSEVYDPATGTWSGAISMVSHHHYHTATLLPNGRVLVVGGLSNLSEVYDPVAGVWSATSPMSTERSDHTATLLPNGQVLVAGGSGFGGTRSSAEVYDPATDTWSMTGTMNFPRTEHTATLLPNGEVLVTGGQGENGSGFPTAEIYNPVTGTWNITSAMDSGRYEHTATLLPSGEVLVTGGSAGRAEDGFSKIGLSSAEVYTPSTGTWRATGSMSSAHSGHEATLLPNGQVLVVGPVVYYEGQPYEVAEMYDPASSTWRPAGGAMEAPGRNATATLLPSGQVLIAGAGTFSTYETTVSAEVYRPAMGFWSPTGSMKTARTQHTATLMQNGRVLVAGGRDTLSSLSSTEVYNPASGTWSDAGSMATARALHTATVLPSGDVLVTGGRDTLSVLSSTEVYNPVTDTWSVVSSMAFPRENHVATLLSNGKVLVTGGSAGEDASLPWAEIYDPATGTWSRTGTMFTPRRNHTATLLPNGRVLVTGGYSYNRDSSRDLTEVYDPETGTWAPTNPMIARRGDHTATLLRNGQVFVAGGGDDRSGFFLPSEEVYDPGTGVWSSLGRKLPFYTQSTATLLQSGQVLILGGRGSFGLRTNAGRYLPDTGIWTTAGDMARATQDHQATLLPSGRVLVTGGTQEDGGLSTAAQLYTP
ncbi:kelch repeat-containing protein [Stigmatella aurantiaca]|uniref:kelch repeat-containing protein n=1 Tax=Stigmatella aurantiaca TaxID=41 RepID=UPI0011604F56|nr:kelch repeat-containing protein [Stigmatella aurantiaca]